MKCGKLIEFHWLTIDKITKSIFPLSGPPLFTIWMWKVNQLTKLYTVLIVCRAAVIWECSLKSLLKDLMQSRRLPTCSLLWELWGAQQWILSFSLFVLGRSMAFCFWWSVFLNSCTSRIPPLPIVFEAHFHVKSSLEREASSPIHCLVYCLTHPLTLSFPVLSDTLAIGRGRILFRNQNYREDVGWRGWLGAASLWEG